ncbi:hypothetical protein [Nostoc sp. FACHB-110]|uniref:hypothetical protein n=1 Tax=Nostoc sp. FACHB-110 TaxID=2692834 RepID=UPI001686829E|nr:hypothetical protein [Nostoc sp. FACHB-110]MBD2441189.1 hypothetical protein [Nostoc sp. FACHB-110]
MDIITKNGRRIWTQIQPNNTQMPTFPQLLGFLTALRSLAALGIAMSKTFILYTGR